jgi:hypothetical protein
MATTTNYGWTTPDDTALVKDGAAAIRTLGSSVDSTLKTQIDNTVASSIQKTLTTTTGDVIYASAANTPARLGIGSTGNVLTVAGGVPTWAAPPAAGNLAQLATGTVSGTSLNLTGLSSYNYIMVQFINLTAGSGPSATFTLNSNTGTLYSYSRGTATDSAQTLGANVECLGGASGGYSATIELNNAKTTGFTDFRVLSRLSASRNFATIAGIFQSSAAISNLTLTFSPTITGGTYTIYGA